MWHSSGSGSLHFLTPEYLPFCILAAEVMKKFDETNADCLPVVDINNRLKGYINRTRMYRTYRQLVTDFSAE